MVASALSWDSLHGKYTCSVSSGDGVNGIAAQSPQAMETLNNRQEITSQQQMNTGYDPSTTHTPIVMEKALFQPVPRLGRQAGCYSFPLMVAAATIILIHQRFVTQAP